MGWEIYQPAQVQGMAAQSVRDGTAGGTGGGRLNEKIQGDNNRNAGTGISRDYLIGIMSGRHSLKKGTIMGAVDKIFDNFEMLYGNYTDMPQTREARYNIFRHIEEKGIDMAQMEPYISALIAEYERQGFLYGFRYASALFLDGTLQYGAGSN